MKLTSITGVVFSLVIGCSLQLGSQDLIYSQFYINPMHTNPSFAGTVAYPKFAINSRLQWPGFDNLYKSYSASYDQYFPDKNIGAGLILQSDNQGDGTIRRSMAKGVFSYNLKFNYDQQIKFGVGLGYVHNRLDWNKLVFFDQIHPVFGLEDGSGNPNITGENQPLSPNNSYLDIDLGLLYYSPKFYIGAGLMHANGPYDGLLGGSQGSQLALPILLTFNAGWQYDILSDNKGKPTTFITPNIVAGHQAGFTQINVGLYGQHSAVFGGLWMRHTIENIDALIFSFGVQTGNLKIGYSYDLTLSNLTQLSSQGSHELGITLGLKHLEKKVSKLNDCFSLFR